MANKLPKSIIKKHGITKKAWKVFRASKAGKTKNKIKTKSVTKARGAKVAKRKGSRKKSKTTAMSRIARKAGAILIPIGLGMVQEPVSNWLSKQKFMGNLPAKYADEIAWFGAAKGAQALGLGSAGYIARKVISDTKVTALNSTGRQLYYDIKNRANGKGSSTGTPNTGVFLS